MSSFTYGYDKQYKCPTCDKFFTKDEMFATNSWRCPTCGAYILIAAPHLGNGHTLIRKMVTELVKYDSVHIPPNSNAIYDVITVEKSSNNEVRVALRNFGKPTFNATDFVSVVLGGYFEDEWKKPSLFTKIPR